MVNNLTDTLVVEATGCIIGIRTESSIVAGGRVLSIIKRVTVCIFCLPSAVRNRTLQDVMRE